MRCGKKHPDNVVLRRTSLDMQNATIIAEHDDLNALDGSGTGHIQSILKLSNNVGLWRSLRYDRLPSKSDDLTHPNLPK